MHTRVGHIATYTPPLKTQQSRKKSRAGKGGFSGPTGGNVASSQAATGHAVSRCADSSQTDSFSWGSPGSGKAAGAGGPPLLVEVGGTSSPPTAVEVAEVEAMGLMLATQREAVAVLAPSAVAAGLVRAVLPSAAKTAAAGEHQHLALLPPQKFQGVEPVAPPLLALGAEAVEVGAACGLLAMKVGAACGLLAMEGLA
ncbi:UNVERIFIED_CONTAM: hypothetical protein FKN15_006729 [Acipenser sinensis]